VGRLASLWAVTLLLAAPATGASEEVVSADAQPAPRVMALARRAHACATAQGALDSNVLAVIDYSLPSTAKRLWVVDLASGRTLFNELVAHGRGSGALYATHFSNAVGSKQSSLGLYRVDEAYVGSHGRSVRLTGLEPGVNDRARERAIVMHSAPYVTPGFAKRHGRLGRSWGCPVVDPAVHGPIFDTLRDGSALFVYHPDEGWLATSPYLHCAGPDEAAG